MSVSEEVVEVEGSEVFPGETLCQWVRVPLVDFCGSGIVVFVDGVRRQVRHGRWRLAQVEAAQA